MPSGKENINQVWLTGTYICAVSNNILITTIFTIFSNKMPSHQFRESLGAVKV